MSVRLVWMTVMLMQCVPTTMAPSAVSVERGLMAMVEDASKKVKLVLAPLALHSISATLSPSSFPPSPRSLAHLLFSPSLSPILPVFTNTSVHPNHFLPSRGVWWRYSQLWADLYASRGPFISVSLSSWIPPSNWWSQLSWYYICNLPKACRQ